MGWEKYGKDEVPEVGDIVSLSAMINSGPFDACIISYVLDDEYTLERPHVFMTQGARYPAVMCENIPMVKKESLVVWRGGMKRGRIDNRLRGY